MFFKGDHHTVHQFNFYKQLLPSACHFEYILFLVCAEMLLRFNRIAAVPVVFKSCWRCCHRLVKQCDVILLKFFAIFISIICFSLRNRLEVLVLI